jgi:hypothetical protein
MHQPFLVSDLQDPLDIDLGQSTMLDWSLVASMVSLAWKMRYLSYIISNSWMDHSTVILSTTVAAPNIKASTVPRDRAWQSKNT